MKSLSGGRIEAVSDVPFFFLLPDLADDEEAAAGAGVLLPLPPVFSLPFLGGMLPRSVQRLQHEGARCGWPNKEMTFWGQVNSRSRGQV